MKFDSKRVNIIFFRHPRAGDLHWIRVSAVADAGQIQMAGIEMGGHTQQHQCLTAS